MAYHSQARVDFVRSSKESDFLDIIDAGVKTMVYFGTNNMMPHFIYCNHGFASSFDGGFQNLTGIILRIMREYGIQSSILTTVSMDRLRIITKEKAKQVAEGKLKNEYYWRHYKGSINDDLDLFINNLQNSNEVDDEDVQSFCTPKLTKEELKLVEEKNKEYMMTYLSEFDADVDVGEMKNSDSKDKYVHFYCRRTTVNLTLESNLERRPTHFASLFESSQ